MDPLTGQSFEHRRTLIEQRIHLLAGCFALSVHAYAVMSNHQHLVIYTDPAAANRWNDHEVIARWRTALPSHKYDSKAPAASDDPAPQPKVSDEWIADKRLRLASLAEWAEQLNAVRCGWRVVGGSAQMREVAQKLGQHRFKRRSRRPGDKALGIKSG